MWKSFLEVRLYEVTEILLSQVTIHKAKSLCIADYAYCRVLINKLIGIWEKKVPQASNHTT